MKRDADNTPAPGRNATRRSQTPAAVLLLFVSIAVLFPAPSEANDRRNFFERKRSSAPSTPRPKTDEELRRNLNVGMGRGFGPNSLQTNLMFLGFFLVMGAVVGALVYYDIHYRRRLLSVYDDPGLLFRQLCAAHGLTRLERRFLCDIADELDLEDALPLFIEPQHFLLAMESSEFAASRPTIRYLLNKLFGIKLDPEPNEIGTQSAARSSLVTRVYR